ncbi:MAG: PQQ-binding-like beta-propeller repeat protein [Planctomycetaceae bacterium]|nr:PQQ-binding-like beta-propeller repeat protein [Planctomycetaceae bacterium]
MRTEFRRREFLKAGLAVAAVNCLGMTQADGMPDLDAGRWVSFRNGPANRGISKSTLPENPKLLWEVPSADGILSTPVIDDGEVYAGGLNGELLCLDLVSGKEKWKYSTAVGLAKNDLPPGFKAPLTLGKSLVYAGDDFGTMRAVDRKTGELKWKVDTEAEIVGGSVLSENGEGKPAQLIFGSHAERLYSLNSDTGELNWMFNTGGPVNGTPLVSGGKTFVTGCSEPFLFIVDVEKGEQADKIELGSLLIASAADVDSVIYFGTDAGVVYALDLKEKKVVWEYSVPDRDYQMHSSPAVTEELVIIGSQDKYLHCIDRKTGKQRWEFRTRGRIDGSPVVVGERVFFGSADKNVYGVTLADGKEVWRHNAGQAFTGSPAVADAKLVIGTDTTNGRLLCFG